MPSRVESRVSDRVVLYRCDKTAVWLARAVQHHKHFAPELGIASVLQDASPQLQAWLLRDARFGRCCPLLWISLLTRRRLPLAVGRSGSSCAWQ